MSNNEMTIDERLKFLLASSESLHASCQELHAIITAEKEKQDKKWERLERAMRAAVLAYFDENGDKTE